MRSVVEIGASVPAFLGKLWKLVNDTETNHLISWSPGGKTFVIKNQADFSRELLPLYYKHNNMASFIRQLNMYGFHKITSVENGGLRYEKDEIEFSHPCFMKGHAYLLEHIKRKIANPKAIVASNENGEKILLKPEIMNKVLTDVKQMKGKQESLDAKFSAMKQENEALWREVAILRQKHLKQQQIVNNLIQFLMSVVQPTRPQGPTNSNGVSMKRSYQLMINNAAFNDGGYQPNAKNLKAERDMAQLEDLIEENMDDGPTIHELAHDDVLNNETCTDSLNSNEMVTVEVSPNVIHNSLSPEQNQIASQYHVTLDGEESDTEDRMSYPQANHQHVSPIDSSSIPSPQGAEASAASRPLPQIVLVPSSSVQPTKIASNKRSNGKTINMRSFNHMTPAIENKLPAEIFASDDSVSDAGAANNDDVSQIAIDPNLILLPQVSSAPKDKMVGGVNIKLEKPQPHGKKSKKTKKNSTNHIRLEDIKTELQDDMDWNINNMSLATVNNNTDRFQKVLRRDYYNKTLEDTSCQLGPDPCKSDIDDHLDTMQTDLDSLRELLRCDSYSLDPNTLLGLFGTDDPFYGLSYNSSPVDERSKTGNNAKKQRGEVLNLSRDVSRALDAYTEDDVDASNQLMSYTGQIPDFEDIQLPELEPDNSQDSAVASDPSSTLNTPLVTLSSPISLLKP